MQRIILALALLFAFPDPTVAAPPESAPAPAHDGGADSIVLVFETEDSAHAFFRWWVGGEGREHWEDQAGAVGVELGLEVDPDHLVIQGINSQAICYQPHCAF